MESLAPYGWLGSPAHHPRLMSRVLLVVGGAGASCLTQGSGDLALLRMSMNGFPSYPWSLKHVTNSQRGPTIDADQVWRKPETHQENELTSLTSVSNFRKCQNSTSVPRLRVQLQVQKGLHYPRQPKCAQCARSRLGVYHLSVPRSASCSRDRPATRGHLTPHTSAGLSLCLPILQTQAREAMPFKKLAPGGLSNSSSA